MTTDSTNNPNPSWGRRTTDKWGYRMKELASLLTALAALIAAAAALIQNMHQENRLDSHKEAIVTNTEAIKAVGQVQSDVVGIPNVAENILPAGQAEVIK